MIARSVVVSLVGIVALFAPQVYSWPECIVPLGVALVGWAWVEMGE